MDTFNTSEHHMMRILLYVESISDLVITDIALPRWKRAILHFLDIVPLRKFNVRFTVKLTKECSLHSEAILVNELGYRFTTHSISESGTKLHLEGEVFGIHYVDIYNKFTNVPSSMNKVLAVESFIGFDYENV